MSRPRVVDYATDAEPVPSKPVVPVWLYGVRGQEVVHLDLPSPVVACTAEEDRARQEYGLQSQIGFQIQRFGVGHPVSYGDQDFSLMDLTTALQLVDESRDAWLRLPKVVRDRYQSWQNVERAAASGELEQVLKAAGAAEASAAAAAASTSDSASVPPKKGDSAS